MKIGLVLHHDRTEAFELAEEFVELAAAEGLELLASSEDAKRLGTSAADLDREQLDAVVAVGGDGTVLEGARLALQTDAAVLGINAGRVGFLADVDPEGLKPAVLALAAGEWAEQQFMTVEAAMPDGSRAVGMNDVVIEKIASQRLVSIELAADDREVITYHADGIVICTPSGSTAYNLSAGGPLVDRRLDALIVTPVASHGLFAKPLVFSPEVELRCRVADDRPVGVAVDGRELGSLGAEEHVEIVRGSRPVRMIQMTGRSFDQVLRKKFGLDSN
ncbi:MAG: NAD(+)/NADH kinase [Acidimicrobiia bacterium]